MAPAGPGGAAARRTGAGRLSHLSVGAVRPPTGLVSRTHAGHLYDRPPEVADHLHELRELLEVHRLRHEGVCSPSGQTLLLAIGCGEDDDRKVPQARILSDGHEHISPVQLWEIEIEENQIRARSVLVRGLAAEERQCFDPVPDGQDAVLEFRTLEPPQRELDVSLVVFNQENGDERRVAGHAADI